jgi:hypothetical protein
VRFPPWGVTVCTHLFNKTNCHFDRAAGATSGWAKEKSYTICITNGLSECRVYKISPHHPARNAHAGSFEMTTFLIMIEVLKRSVHTVALGRGQGCV